MALANLARARKSATIELPFCLQAAPLIMYDVDVVMTVGSATALRKKFRLHCLDRLGASGSACGLSITK
jgi:hypothetical protein